MAIFRRTAVAIFLIIVFLTCTIHQSAQTMFVYSTLPPQLPLTGLVSQWNFTEGFNQWVFNRTGPSAYPTTLNLFGNGSEQFEASAAYSETWSTSATTLTDNFADDPNSHHAATRLVTSAPGGGIVASLALTAIPYTMSIYVKSNTGSSQAVQIGNLAALSGDLAVTTSWTRISATFTPVAGTVTLALVDDVAHDPLDILIYGAQLETGSSPTAYKVPVFDLQLGSQPIVDAHDPTWISSGQSLGSGIYNYGITSTGATTVTAMTIHALVKKTGSDLPSGVETVVNTGAGATTLFSINSLDTLDNSKGNPAPQFTIGGSGGPVTYANSVILGDGNWHLLTGVYDGTTAYFYFDGTEVGRLIGSVSAQDVKRIYFGAFPNLSPTTYYFPGNVGISAFYNRAQSAVEIRQTFAAMQGAIACRSVALSNLRTMIVNDGDSISDIFITLPIAYNEGWAYLLRNSFSPALQGRNLAVSGSTMTEVNTRLATTIATFNPTTLNNIYIFQLGANDLAATTAAPFVAAVKSHLQAVRAAGFKVILVTVLPRTLAGFNARRNAANLLYKADPSFYDALVDLDTTALGPDAAAADLTLYSDGTHPTVFGQTLIWPAIKAQLVPLLN